MQTLSKGYKKPQTGDFGSGASGWFPAMEDNIDQLNDHEHDGVDGFQIKSSNLDGQIVSVLSGAFVDQGDGYWRATVNSPGGVNINKIQATMRDATTREVMYGKVIRASNTAVYVYLNIATDIEVLFGV